MKKNITSLLLIFFAVCALTSCKEAPAPEAASTSPNGESVSASVSATPYFSSIQTQDLSGQPVTDSLFSGHTLTMVNVWATFCGPCVNEMPELQKLSEKYASDGFQIIGIVSDTADSYGRPLSYMIAKAQSISNQCGTQYPHLVPSVSMIRERLSGMMYVPTTVFLDRDGCQIGEEIIGAQNAADWDALIRQLLNEVTK